MPHTLVFPPENSSQSVETISHKWDRVFGITTSAEYLRVSQTTVVTVSVVKVHN